jgi:hypothetical protein
VTESAETALQEQPQPPRRSPAPRKPRAPQLEVEVTAEIIEDSKSRDSGHCMVAEGTKAAFKEKFGYLPTHVSVDIQTIRLTDPEKNIRITYLTPLTTQKAILQFDQGMTPEPFSVQLRQGQVTLANRRTRTAGKEKKPPTAKQLAAAKNAGEAFREGAGLPARKGNMAIEKEGSKVREGLKKAGLQDNGSGKVPSKSGGSPPPTTPVGRRRAFGLRGIEY